MQVVLLPPLAKIRATSPAARRLVRRLARARPLPSLPPGRGAQLEAFFGIATDALATLAAVVDGLEGGRAWVRVEPVLVHVDIAALRLVAFGEGIGLTAEEELGLFAQIGDWCRGAGLEAQRTGPLRWYLAQPADWPCPESDPPERWLGRVLDRQWRPPRGPWGRLLAELEMLLANDPINEARRARGLPTVSGVWVWGGACLGAAEAPRVHPGGRLLSDDPLLAACARRAGMEAVPLAAEASRRGAALLDLAADLSRGEWLAPPLPAQWWFACGRRFLARRRDAFRFWRRPDGEGAAFAEEREEYPLGGTGER